MSTEWFCKVSDREIGPLTLQQIKSMADRGKLQPNDLIRRGETGSWLTAGKVKGLFATAAGLPSVADSTLSKSGSGKSSAPSSAMPAAKDPTAKESGKPSKILQAEAIPMGIPLGQKSSSASAAKPDSSKLGRPAAGKPGAGKPPLPKSTKSDDSGTLDFLEETVPVVTRKPASKSSPPIRHEDLLAAAIAPRAGSTSNRSGPGGRLASEESGKLEALAARRRRQKKFTKIMLVPLLFLVLLGLSVGGYYLFRPNPAVVAQRNAEAAKKAAAEKQKARVELRDDTEDDDVKKQAAAISSTAGAPVAAAGTASAKVGPAAAPDKQDWIDAEKGSAEWKEPRISVKIESAQFGLPPGVRAVGAGSAEGKHPLMLTVSLENGEARRDLDYKAWSTEGPTLKDNQGKSYRQIRFIGKDGSKRTIVSGRQVRDPLFFERPASTVKTLRLELPAAAFGGKGLVRFEIPYKMITEAPAALPASAAAGTASAPLPAPSADTAGPQPPRPVEDPDSIPALVLGDPVKEVKTGKGRSSPQMVPAAERPNP